MELRDELQALRALIADRSAFLPGDLEKVTAAIQQNWMAAAFQDVSDECLRRYFSDHLKVLSSLSERCGKEGEDQIQEALLSLIDGLLDSRRSLLNENLFCPPAFIRREFARIGEHLKGWHCPLPSIPSDWLSVFLGSWDSLSLTFGQVRYLTVFIVGLGKARTEPETLCYLVTENFNHTGLFRSLTLTIKGDDLADLARLRSSLRAIPVRQGAAFDPSWCTLKEMIVGWLDEEIALRHEAPATLQEKLHLNTSVAHLACLLRLFYEEGFLFETSLTRIFRQVNGNIRTKKQSLISEGSLSKEFYATDQHTAGRVRDLLQRMLVRLNRKFFP
ncbi:hypothetical protein FPZ42_06985 [Mucilaginibacter achroorhodeus]|uniref:Uncharacterized protein n=1 Tax=Mucilaginibacter achroorhodeus TaxID=2599294 RepID=A0A563U617_9SPHI|nr:hypothetical protein [Mucilaginibacter achroorhodeus]TWR26775.1 hypothetical protein FPZ42_06985 [Mucilaginibacter achroorhodeus]